MLPTKYSKITKIKQTDYKFTYYNEIIELLEVIVKKKKRTLKKLKKISNAPIFNWIEKLSIKELEAFSLDIYFADLMEIFGELTKKIFTGLF
jgi:hypothetical protein